MPENNLTEIPKSIDIAARAVMYGAVWRGFDGPDGITKDEALEYAGELAEWVLKLEEQGVTVER